MPWMVMIEWRKLLPIDITSPHNIIITLLGFVQRQTTSAYSTHEDLVELPSLTLFSCSVASRLSSLLDISSTVLGNSQRGFLSSKRILWVGCPFTYSLQRFQMTLQRTCWTASSEAPQRRQWHRHESLLGPINIAWFSQLTEQEKGTRPCGKRTYVVLLDGSCFGVWFIAGHGCLLK